MSEPMVQMRNSKLPVRRTVPAYSQDVDMDAKMANAVSAADFIIPTKVVKHECESPEIRDVHSTSFDGVYTHGSSKALRITCYATGSVHFASADPGDGLLRISNAGDEVSVPTVDCAT